MKAYVPITILPEFLANQIAAGEVVQRPESVVKELVENALDAGATSITVVVRQSGKQLIHVIDNGSGMERDDLELSIVRHATSKLRTVDDLHAIHSLGFRGEALASIAAVADVEVRTQRRDQVTGWTLSSRPGEQHTVQPASHDVGTQVLVRNLFYNVPARRKFLKADLTEFRYISETMQRLALSRPDVRFTFYDGSALTFDVLPGDVRDRVGMLMGVNPETTLIPVEGEENGVSVRGFVGVPSVARQSRSGQFLFLNNRAISSRSLSHAVVVAFEHMLESGQHPLYLLNLEVDARRVDVNVHPQKHEVKFDDERSVYLLIQRSVGAGLQKARIIAPLVSDLQLASQPLQSLGGTASGLSYVVNRLTGEVLQASATSPSYGAWGTKKDSGTVHRNNRDGIAALFGGLSQDVESTQRPKILYGAGRWIVMLHREGLAVLDQRAAHERILYDRAMRSPHSVSAEQALLFAAHASIATSHRVLVREYSQELESIGFRLELIEGGDVRVLAVPTDVVPGTEEEILKEMLHDLEAVGRLPTDRKRASVALAYAKRQAVRRGHALGESEQQEIARDLFSCSMPHVSPSGSPTYIIISFDELAQRFQ